MKKIAHNTPSTKSTEAPADTTQAKPRVERGPIDDILDPMHTGDPRSGALMTLSALLHAIQIVGASTNVGVEDGMTEEQWDQLLFFAQMFAESAESVARMRDLERRRAEAQKGTA